MQIEPHFIDSIRQLLQQARSQVIRQVNQTMVLTYYEIGRMIVDDEQQGQQRAAYGKQVLKELSTKLTQHFGKGFSVDNLENMRQFYLKYQNTISEKSSRKFALSWSHYLKLMRIANEDERSFYEIESQTNN
jgi:predicted nuclease of restriction endonuclease-like (RecB) superfamily